MKPADYQKKIHEIQAEFQGKIERAARTGDNAAMSELVLEMQKRMQSIAAEFEIAVAASASPTGPVYGTEDTSLPLDRIAYGADREYFRQASSNPEIVKAVNDFAATGALARGRRHLLATAMRLTPNVSKPLFEIVNRCRTALGLKLPMDLFVLQDRMFNAAILPKVDGKLTVYFTSGLLESFGPDELAFIVGHEMGHALFRHIDIPIDGVLSQLGHSVTPKDVIRMRSWQRAAELSADRAGLLCSRDFTSACQAFFKLSSGITTSNYRFSVDDYMDQYADLEKYIKASGTENMEEFYSTHPLNPIRLKALELFSRSATYHELGGNAIPADSLDESSMEGQIKTFMSLMEPSYLEEKSDMAATIREFMFYAGVMVAKADGMVDTLEIKQLSNLLDGQDATVRVAEAVAMDPKQVIEKICKAADKINFEVSPVQRLNIIRDVFTIAAADGTVSDVEINEMAKVCGVLQINPGFLEELLRALPTPAAAA